MAIGIIGKVDYIKYRPIPIPKTMVLFYFKRILVLHVTLSFAKNTGVVVFARKLRFRCAALVLFDYQNLYKFYYISHEQCDNLLILVDYFL